MAYREMNKKVILLILDGWGIAPPDKFNAIDNAYTPNFDRLIRDYPDVSLKTDGESVGLIEGQFGTSETNHLTIGLGRVLMQELPKINNAIKDESFYHNEALVEVVKNVEQEKSRLHLTGILSDGGVHSKSEHLFAIFELLSRMNFSREIYLHLFTDGRDVPPKSAEKYFLELEEQIKRYQDLNIIIGTVQGRAFLDRDRDWDKTAKTIGLIVDNKGNPMNSWQSIINFEYNRNTTDEYFAQYVLNESKIRKNDGLIVFHYRTDRIYQLIKAILDRKIDGLTISSFVQASDSFASVKVAFPKEKMTNTLADLLAAAKKTQLHVTETEKYRHVTYFFDGEREQELPGEKWELFKSNRFVKPYYRNEPSMQNFKIAQCIIDSIDSDEFDFIVANFSSADMVGHTGDYNAAVVSAQSVDFCLGKIYEAIADKLDKYALLVTADHGNSEIMWDYENDQPHTQHTFSKVPFILVSDIDTQMARRETLTDIAPTILDLMGLKPPKEMTGRSLLID